MENKEALLIVSYGGPEEIKDVEPFLNRLLFGKKVPEIRRQTALQKYYNRHGHSPIQQECRDLIHALSSLIQKKNDSTLPFVIYWGNLYAPPLLNETIQQMSHDGISSFVLFLTSSFDSPQSCQRYLQAVQKGIEEIQTGCSLDLNHIENDSTTDQPIDNRFIINKTAFYSNRFKKPNDISMSFVKTPFFLNHPSYLRASADALLETLAKNSLDHCFTEDAAFDQENEPLILFSTHSLPIQDAIAAHYQEQFEEHCQHVIQMIDSPNQSLNWKLVFQSRSGSPFESWTEPSLENEIRQYKKSHPNWNRLIVSPIGFFLENMETVYDLDVELAQLCQELEITLYRVPTFGRKSRVVQMIVDFL
ncbi:MAG: ferrochelatase [Planctomycetia bacterium]|nr:ferrochelatase [Planctomycetia bacterium]